MVASLRWNAKWAANGVLLHCFANPLPGGDRQAQLGRGQSGQNGNPMENKNVPDGSP